MPDIRPVTRYTREMSTVERRYLKNVRSELRATRLVLLERLYTDGLNSYDLPQSIWRELDTLRLAVQQIGREQISDIDIITTTLAAAEFEQAAKLAAGAAPNFELAQIGTTAQRRSILAGLVDNIGNWVDSLQSRLNSELARLRAAGETPESGAARLFAEQIADGRASEWRLAGNTMSLAGQKDLWTAGTALVGSYRQAGQSQTGQRWQKQAIAAIDERTTDCCLRVHGQIQDLDTPFELIGTPRYANRQQHAPFHDFCRTAETLWLQEFEGVGVTTEQMESAAQAELDARERTGRRVEIHPAHATSRR